MKLAIIFFALLLQCAFSEYKPIGPLDIYNVFNNKIKERLNNYLGYGNDLNKMHFKFVEQFIRSFVSGEIKIYDWALNSQSNLPLNQVEKIN